MDIVHNFTSNVKQPAGAAIIINGDQPMMEWAGKYLDAKLHPIPLHVPIIHEGGRTGCSCEDFKRSDKYRQFLEERGRGREFDPAYQCPQPGKHPIGYDWEGNSVPKEGETEEQWRKRILKQWGWVRKTVDVETGATVRYLPNMGVAAGPSNWLVLDADSYKENYAGGDLLSFGDKETPTSITGNGGEHLVYDRAGADYGNDRGTLPEGVDVRGVGGQIAVEPSLHKSGRRYQWEEGYSPFDIKPQPLPESLRSILETAHQKKKARAAAAANIAVKFGQVGADAPDLAQWSLSPDAVDLIHNPAAKGQRSEHDMRVVRVLCRAGADDDAILAIFTHYPVGADGKFAERGADYLARTIANARAYQAEQEKRPGHRQTVRPTEKPAKPAEATQEPRPPEGLQLLAALSRRLQWGGIAAISESRHLMSDLAVMVAMFRLAIDRGRHEDLAVGLETLRRQTGLGSTSTVRDALTRLEGAGAIRLERAGDKITKADVYTIVLDSLRKLILPESQGGNYRGKAPCDLRQMSLPPDRRSIFERHMSDDLFCDGRGDLAKDLGMTTKPAGKLGLLCIDILCGLGRPADVQELASITGASVRSTWAALHRAHTLGLIERQEVGGDRRGRAHTYSARDGWTHQAAEVTPMVESYGVGLDRGTDAAWNWYRHCNELLNEHKDQAIKLEEAQVNTLKDWQPQALAEFRVLRQIADAAKRRDLAEVQAVVSECEIKNHRQRIDAAVSDFRAAGHDLNHMKPFAIERVFWAWCSVNGYPELVNVRMVDRRQGRRETFRRPPSDPLHEPAYQEAAL